MAPIPYWREGYADVAEIPYVPFRSRGNETALRLIARRVRPAPGSQLALLADYSYHPFITDRGGDMLELERDHRRHPPPPPVCDAGADNPLGPDIDPAPAGLLALGEPVRRPACPGADAARPDLTGALRPRAGRRSGEGPCVSWGRGTDCGVGGSGDRPRRSHEPGSAGSAKAERLQMPEIRRSRPPIGGFGLRRDLGKRLIRLGRRYGEKSQVQACRMTLEVGITSPITFDIDRSCPEARHGEPSFDSVIIWKSALSVP